MAIIYRRSMHADNRKHYREVTNIIETCHKPESDETRSTPPAALNSNERSGQRWSVASAVWAGARGSCSLPICVGYLVFICAVNTGCEISCFSCFFRILTSFCCCRSSSLPSSPPGPISMSSSRSISSASDACRTHELCCFSRLWKYSIFSIFLARVTRSCGGQTPFMSLRKLLDNTQRGHVVLYRVAICAIYTGNVLARIFNIKHPNYSSNNMLRIRAIGAKFCFR